VSIDPNWPDQDAHHPLPPPHPAKFTAKHLNEVIEILGDNPTLLILDPFAGIGTIHDLPYMTTGIEIEPEWAYQREGTAVGSALRTGYDEKYFDAVVTSPCFGNRMADHHDAKDDSKRHTYRHYLGRELTKGSAAGMQWGEEYKHFHTEAWLEAKKILKVGGHLIINIKDHIRNGQIQHVTQWHAETCRTMGFKQQDTRIIPVSGLTHGENAEHRIPHESLLVFCKPEKLAT